MLCGLQGSVKRLRELNVDRRQLELLHRITVAAMKCKQTTDTAHVATLRTLAHEFSETYFSKEDMEHLKEHSWDGK